MRTLLTGAVVVTLDEAGTVLQSADVAVEDGRVVAVGEVPGDFAADERVDASGHALMPALFNGHCHSPMTFERGWAEDLPLDRWFNERIWVAESGLTEDDVLWGARLAACEMIRAGVVGFNDHYFHMDHVAQVVRDAGMKASLAWCVFGIGRDKEVGADLEGTLAFIDRWQGEADGRIRTVLGPHSPYVCPPSFLEEVATVARERGLALHIHAAEAPDQVERSLKQHGRTPVAHLAASGLFDVPCTVAHGLYVDDEDLALLATPNVTVVRCPITYMKLAMGTTSAERLAEAGVRLGLGTDGPGSNNDMDMFAVARIFALLQKHVTGDATVFAGDAPLRLATRGAAAACGFPGSGVLVPGAPADLILVDLNLPRMRPCHDVVANLVHGGSGAVTDAMCDGRWLMRSRQLLTLDEERILAEADERARAMVGRATHTVRDYRG